MTLGRGWKPDLDEHISESPKMGALVATERFGSRATPKDCNLLGQHCLVRDQLLSESCFGFAVTGLTYARLRLLGYDVEPLSPLAAYAIARQMEGIYRGQELPDTGSYPYLGMIGSSRFGFVPESMWKFGSNYRDVISKEVPFDLFEKASQFRISQFSRITLTGIDRVEACVRALSLGHPIHLGMMVGREFENYRKGLGPVGIETKNVGGHATFLVGYEDDGEVFIGCNSWGQDYGDEGFYRIHRSKLEHESTSDLYDVIITDQKAA